MKKSNYTAPLLSGAFHRPLETREQCFKRMDEELKQWHKDNKEWLLKVFRNNPKAIENVYRACDELPPPPEVIILDDPEIWIEDEGNERGNEAAIDLTDYELDIDD